MSFGEQCKFFERAIELEEEVGIPVANETHRGRTLFTPWTTRDLLQAISKPKLNADFSHWSCVCESLLEEHAESFELAIQRSILSHARVGRLENPQATHPSTPEWRDALDAHLGWW